MTKFIKLLGHYIRYPGDFLLLPISILFGYLHGLIKAYAMLSLNVVRYALESSIDDANHMGLCSAEDLDRSGGGRGLPIKHHVDKNACSSIG